MLDVCVVNQKTWTGMQRCEYVERRVCYGSEPTWPPCVPFRDGLSRLGPFPCFRKLHSPRGLVLGPLRRIHMNGLTGVPHLHEEALPWDPIVGLCLGSSGGPRGAGIFLKGMYPCRRVRVAAHSEQECFTARTSGQSGLGNGTYPLAVSGSPGAHISAPSSQPRRCTHSSRAWARPAGEGGTGESVVSRGGAIEPACRKGGPSNRGLGRQPPAT